MVSYVKDDQTECNRVQVIIQDVNISDKTAATREALGGQSITVDLSLTNGHTIVWPRISEHWYCIKVSGNWVLDKKCSFGNEGFQEEAVPGDQVTVTTGNYKVKAGAIRLDDGVSSDVIADFRSSISALTGTTSSASGSATQAQMSIANLYKAIYGLSNRTEPPICEIRLASDYALPAQSDTWAAGSWSTITKDNMSFFTLGTGQAAPSYLTTPLDGRYRIYFHASVIAPSAGLIAARVVSGTNNVNNTIAIDTKTPFGTNNNEVALNATNEIFISANTKIYWETYINLGTNNAATMKASIFGMPSMMSLRWVGAV